MSAKVVAIIIGILLAAASASAQCPSITLSGPSGVTLDGDAMTFRAEVAVSGPRLDYKWTISAGPIEEGQGTEKIIVRTDKSMANTNVVATVEVIGLPSACEKTASAAGPIGRILCNCFDEWGTLKPNEIRSRLDAFFADLSNNPDNTGILTLVVTAKEPMEASNKRLQFIVRHVAFRKFDRRRIWFQFELGDEIQVRTKAYRLPPGAELLCKECLTIKGVDIQ